MKSQIWNFYLKSLNSKDDLLEVCPKCQMSKLHFLKYHEQITEIGKDLHKHGYPYGIEHLYIGLLQCKNDKCSQIVQIAGKIDKGVYQLISDELGNFEEYEYDILTPEYFSPSLRYFKIHNEVPKAITAQLDLSFYHFFKDPNSSANKIRTVLEMILDYIKAPKKTKNKNGKYFKFPNLHTRINHYIKKNKIIGTLMLANKYIGNEGSHNGETDRTELIQAFDNIEEILDTLFVKTRRTLLTKAENLIQSKQRKQYD